MKNYLLVTALSASVSILAMSSAMAQSVNDDPSLEAYELGQIVLYGDRSAETLADSNASVAVVTADDLKSPLTSQLRSGFARVANASAGPGTESGFILRGINSEGLTPGAFGTPLASFYIDGVLQTVESTRRGARGLFDTQQLEIYRGPQSTLSGRAALAGAVYLRSMEPTFDNSGKVQLTYGENNHRQIGAMINTKLSENLAFRLSGEWSEKTSDINYPSYQQYALYDDYVTDDYAQYRARLLWTPAENDATRVLFSYTHSKNEPYQNNIVGPGSTSDFGEVVSYADLRGDFYGSLSSAGYFIALPVFQDVRETTSDSIGIEVTHDISSALKFTSMTGWNQSVTDRRSINVGTTPTSVSDYLTHVTEFKDQIFSQEFRLNYDNGVSRWVVGLYGAHETGDGEGFMDLEAAGLGASGWTTDTATTNLALFGELKHEFAPDWRLIAGGRIDYFKRKSNHVANSYFGGTLYATTVTNSTFEDTVIVPKIGIERNIGNDGTLAFIYQQGYRPGGAGIRASDSLAYNFDAESTHNYELSYRATAMNGRLSIGAAAFYQEWSNQQVEIWDGGVSAGSYITNVGDSKSYGAELELSYALNNTLDIYSSIGLLHTKFGSFVVGSDDYSGMPFSGAAKQNISLGYRCAGDNGWFSSGAATYTSATTSTLASTVAAYGLDSYVVVDMEVGYAWDNGATVTAYATNLFDNTYFVNNSGTDVYSTLGDRREIGLQFGYEF